MVLTITLKFLFIFRQDRASNKAPVKEGKGGQVQVLNRLFSGSRTVKPLGSFANSETMIWTVYSGRDGICYQENSPKSLGFPGAFMATVEMSGIDRGHLNYRNDCLNRGFRGLNRPYRSQDIVRTFSQVRRIFATLTNWHCYK